MGDQVMEIEEIEEDDIRFNPYTLHDPAPYSPGPSSEQILVDNKDEERRIHREKKRGGSGGLPLYVFLQDGSNGEGRRVDPRCPNRSNPFHVCTNHCIAKINESNFNSNKNNNREISSPLSFLSRHSSSSSGSSSGKIIGENRKVDPRCPNASNPYHECAQYCFNKLRESGHTGPTLSVENSPRVELRKVDPTCPNASNPYHVCTESCVSKSKSTPRNNNNNNSRAKLSFSFFSRNSSSSSSVSGRKVMGENRKVDPRCPNASNPYHECASYCFNKLRESGHVGPALSGHDDIEFAKSREREIDVSDRDLQGHSGLNLEDNNSEPEIDVQEEDTPGHNDCNSENNNNEPEIDLQEQEETPDINIGEKETKPVESRRVDPACVNASNPYHQCHDYCFNKQNRASQSDNTATPANVISRKSKDVLNKVERREDVNPDCKNASNPYHKCSNSCSERMQR